MILTKKQLRRRIEQSAIPARLHSIAFAEITKHRRLMWETELIKMDMGYNKAMRAAQKYMNENIHGMLRQVKNPDIIYHNEEHAI